MDTYQHTLFNEQHGPDLTGKFVTAKAKKTKTSKPAFKPDQSWIDMARKGGLF